METLNIYKIWVNELLGYDTYDSVIVVAENEEAARHIHPGNAEYPVGGYNSETERYDKPWYESDEPIWDWTKPENVNVALVGTTDFYAEGTVLCASFNAGVSEYDLAILSKVRR